MRPIITTILYALAAAALAAPAVAAVNAYLELPPIKGESADKSAPARQIEISSWSWGSTNSAKFGAVSGAHRDDSLSAPAEKRQHGWMPSNRPLASGGLRVKVKFPWLDCKVGAAFPDATLQNDAGRYELKDIQVTGCAADEVALDYRKVTVRGWDPQKKE